MRCRRRAHADNLLRYYRHMRDNDIYVVYAVVPPQAARNPEFYHGRTFPVPTLRVVREDDDGVVISGMKMLATGALYANEIWIGNVIPLAPDQKKEAITCAVPCNAPGLSLWSRKPAAVGLTSEFEFAARLALRRERQHGDVRQRQGAVGEACSCTTTPCSRAISTSRRRATASAITSPTCATGRRCGCCSACAARSRRRPAPIRFPAVRETLGKMAAVESTIGGLVHGQINACETGPRVTSASTAAIMYAGLDWCTQNYSKFIDELRELCGGGVFQMPADISVMQDPDLAKQFATYWQTPQADAVTRMKLFKLAWDMVGSEFAGRHLQYEKFYAGASFIIRNHSYRETDWAEFNKLVEDLMASYDYCPPDATPRMTEPGLTLVRRQSSAL